MIELAKSHNHLCIYMQLFYIAYMVAAEIPRCELASSSILSDHLRKRNKWVIKKIEFFLIFNLKVECQTYFRILCSGPALANGCAWDFAECERAAASYALVLQWIRDRVCEAGLPTRDSHRSNIPNYSDHTTLMQDVNRS